MSWNNTKLGTLAKVNSVPVLALSTTTPGSIHYMGIVRPPVWTDHYICPVVTVWPEHLRRPPVQLNTWRPVLARYVHNKVAFAFVGDKAYPPHSPVYGGWIVVCLVRN